MTTPEQEDLGRTAPIQRPTPETSTAPQRVDDAHVSSPSAQGDEVVGNAGPDSATQDIPPPPGTAGEAGPMPNYVGQSALAPDFRSSAEAAPAAQAATAADRNILYIPLAVSIGDGFKFGCGFFLASVLAMLVGFVLLTVLFVLTNLFGLSVPLGR